MRFGRLSGAAAEAAPLLGAEHHIWFRGMRRQPRARPVAWAARRPVQPGDRLGEAGSGHCARPACNGAGRSGGRPPNRAVSGLGVPRSSLLRLQATGQGRPRRCRRSCRPACKCGAHDPWVGRGRRAETGPAGVSGSRFLWQWRDRHSGSDLLQIACDHLVAFRDAAHDGHKVAAGRAERDQPLVDRITLADDVEIFA